MTTFVLGRSACCVRRTVAEVSYCATRCGMAFPGLVRHLSTVEKDAGVMTEAKSTATKLLNPFTSFDTSMKEVTNDDVPSAREVSRMLPSAQQLHMQIPSAKSLELKYMQVPDASTTTANAAAAAPISGVSRLLCNPAMMEQTLCAESTHTLPSSPTTSEKHRNLDVQGGEVDGTCQTSTMPDGSATFSVEHEGDSGAHLGSVSETYLPALDGGYVLLAYKALMLGTLYAIVGFVFIVGISMRMCGFYSIDDLKKGVRDKFERENERALLECSAGAGGASGSEEKIEFFVIDLSDKATAWTKIMESWKAIQDMAEQGEKS